MSPSQIIILLLVKIMAGIFYGWIGTYYGGLAQMYDTWNYHSLSIHEYNLLFKDPASYLANLFHNPYDNGLNNFFSSSNSYWNDLKSNVFIKLLSVFNIFTFGNYYVNVILYSFLTLFGPIALFRVMSDAFPEKRTTVLLFTFIIPSFLFWTSGLGKEGLLFAGIGMLIYSVYFGLKERKWGIIRIINIIICTLIILTFRNFVLVLLIPAVLVWIIANRRPEKAKLIFSVAYLFLPSFFLCQVSQPQP
ncbi:MAG: hypothetical protein IPH18_00115 [Chitinophagaceae bacterium]|nr:hypothetical protein [Chitinophagaceae bacterium]